MKPIRFLAILVLCVCSFLACKENANFEEIPTEGVPTEEVPTSVAPKYSAVPKYKALLECMNMPRPADSYNYPVWLGMEEWAQFKTGQEMTDACQVPEDILKTMSTQAVIQAIWEYPFLTQLLHRLQYQSDFEGTFLQNNAYNELTKRANAGTALLKRLLVVDPVNSGARVEPQAFEVLTSQVVFLSQLDDDAKKKLIEVSLKNDELRKNLKWAFRETTCLLIGRTLVSANYTPFMEYMNKDEQLRLFIDPPKLYAYFEFVYGAVPQIIVEYAEKYLTDN